MQQLIQLIIYIVIFAVIAYGIFWVCTKFAMPQPVMWIAGAILLIILLIFAAGQFGSGHSFHLFGR